MLRRSFVRASGAIPLVMTEAKPLYDDHGHGHGHGHDAHHHGGGGHDHHEPPKPKAVVLLSGCGVFDGSEIQEATCALIALEQAGFAVSVAAPYMQQMHVIDHATGDEVAGASRNVFNEAARIARGAPLNVAAISAQDYDCLVLPGGYGVMKNLSNFAVEGPQGKVQDEVAAVVREFYMYRRAIGGICAAPVVLAAVLGPEIKAAKRPPLKMTLGSVKGDMQQLAQSFGSIELVEVGVTSCFRDLSYEVVTTPAYMSDDATPANIFKGISFMGLELKKIVDQRKTGVSKIAV